MGRTNDIDLSDLFDENLTLEDDVFKIPGFNHGGWNARLYRESGLYPADQPLKSFTEAQREDFLYKEPTRMKIAGINMTYEGLIPRIEKSILSKDKESMQKANREFADRAVTFVTCPECGGTRLNQAVLKSKIEGKNIAELTAMQVTDLAQWMRQLQAPQAQSLIDSIQETLDAFVHIGLGYISLDRPAATLSGGEAQRAKMIRHLGSALTDVEIGVMAKVSLTCETCEGKRFNQEVLQYTLGDKNISEVLELSAEEALEFFSAAETKIPAVAKTLNRMVEVGLGYLTLGQHLARYTA